MYGAVWFGAETGVGGCECGEDDRPTTLVVSPRAVLTSSIFFSAVFVLFTVPSPSVIGCGACERVLLLLFGFLCWGLWLSATGSRGGGCVFHAAFTAAWRTELAD